MNDHVSDEQLQDHVSGTLAGADSVALELHLAECEACRRQADAVRNLLAELAALRGPIAPPRDLRADIWRAVDSASSEPAGQEPGRVEIGQWRPRFGQRTLSSTRVWLAAAAIGLVLVSSVLTWQVASRRGRPPSIAALPVAAEYVAVAARYVAATDELEQFLDAQRAALSPETVRILDESLRVIDRALAEAKEAMDGDPGNADLSRMLIATYEKKLGLLRSAAQGQVGI